MSKQEQIYKGNNIQEEFLAIRFHMSLRNKESHHLYGDALASQLRYLVHKSDGKSAKCSTGCNPQ
jgi:hypothetical protein